MLARATHAPKVAVANAPKSPKDALRKPTARNPTKQKKPAKRIKARRPKNPRNRTRKPRRLKAGKPTLISRGTEYETTISTFQNAAQTAAWIPEPQLYQERSRCPGQSPSRSEEH